VKKKPSNSKGGNKRLRQRQHVLDVTLTESKERARRRRRIAGRVCRLILTVAVVVGAVVGGKEVLRRFVWENPDYQVSEIVFQTDGTLLRDDVLETAHLTEGVNIFKVELAKARDIVAALPQVEHAELRREFPNRLSVHIVERKPIAWVMNRGEGDPTQSKKAYLIDARAIPMKPRSVLHQYLRLPIITGFPVENLADGQRLPNYEIQAALDLIRRNADNTHWQIETVDVGSGYSLVVTDSRRIQLTFHLDNLDRQLTRLDKLFTIIGGERQQELQKVNLFGERNTYVTFRPPPEPEPEPALVPPNNVARPPSKPGAQKPTPTPKPTTAPKPKAKPTPTPAPRKSSSLDHLKKPFNSHGQR
jgi:hypothetical protein